MARLSRAPARNIKFVDGLRAFAILWVIAFHSVWMCQYSGADYSQLQSSRILGWVFRGHFGVDIFFCLSGFLIARILLREQSIKGRLSIGHFYGSRALRLLPAYYCSLALFWLVRDVMPAELYPADSGWVWANLLYVNNFVTWDAQYMKWAWSLAIEEQFYIVFPVLLVLLYRCPGHRRFPVLLGLLLVAFAITVFVFVAFVTAENYMDVMYVKPHTRVGAILIGVIVAWMAHYGILRRQLERWTSLAVWSGVGILLALALVPKPSDPVLLGGYLMTSHYVVALGTGLLILGCYRESGSIGAELVRRVLGARLWYPVAQLSYSAYLLHVMVIAALYRVWSPTTPLEVIAIIPVTVCLSLIASIPLHVLVERPVMELRSAHARRALLHSWPGRLVGSVVGAASVMSPPTAPRSRASLA